MVRWESSASWVYHVGTNLRLSIIIFTTVSISPIVNAAATSLTYSVEAKVKHEQRETVHTMHVDGDGSGISLVIAVTRRRKRRTTKQEQALTPPSIHHERGYTTGLAGPRGHRLKLAFCHYDCQ